MSEDQNTPGQGLADSTLIFTRSILNAAGIANPYVGSVLPTIDSDGNVELANPTAVDVLTSAALHGVGISVGPGLDTASNAIKIGTGSRSITDLHNIGGIGGRVVRVTDGTQDGVQVATVVGSTEASSSVYGYVVQYGTNVVNVIRGGITSIIGGSQNGETDGGGGETDGGGGETDGGGGETDGGGGETDGGGGETDGGGGETDGGGGETDGGGGDPYDGWAPVVIFGGGIGDPGAPTMGGDGIPGEDNSSPLIIDLDGDGIELLAFENSEAVFDLLEDGFLRRTGWTNGDDAFLAMDRNGNGYIDDSSELFGSATEDGFAQLSLLDTNEDGIISELDDQFESLLLWQDVDSDGVTDDGELGLASAQGLVSVDLGAVVIDETNAGHDVSHRSSVSWEGGETRIVEDIWFQYSEKLTKFYDADASNITLTSVVLPDLRGYGTTKGLFFEYGNNENLVEYGVELEELSRESDISGFIRVFDQFLAEWTGAAGAEEGSRGDNVDAQHLAVYEGLYGRTFDQGFNGDTPGGQAGALLENAYDGLSLSFAARYIVQTMISTSILYGNEVGETHSLQLLGDVTYDVSTDRLSDTISDLPAVLATGFSGGEGDLSLIDLALLASLFSADYEAYVGGSITNAFGDAGLAAAHVDFIASVSEKDILFATDGQTHIVGTGQSELIDGDFGDNTFSGGYGSDIYVWGEGRGNDVIDEYGYGSADSDTITLDGLNAADVTLSRIGNDLEIVATASGETLTVQDHFSGTVHGIETIVFADGEQMNRSAIVSAAWLRGGDGDDTLTGSRSSETFDGGGGNDLLKGGYGSDTYVWGEGRGNDVIDEYGYGSADSDTITLDGLNAADVTLSRIGNDLEIVVTASGETLTVQDHFSGTVHGIETVVFADGSSASRSGIVRMVERDAARAAIGAASSDTISGTSGQDFIAGGAGTDLMKGGNGSDFYVIREGDGQDTIDENGSNDTDIVFFAEHLEGEVVVSRNGGDPDDLRLTYGTSGDTLLIKNTLNGSYYDTIEAIEFSDGSSWSMSDVRAILLNQDSTDGDDTIDGFYAADVIDGGLGDDRIIGSKGNDVLRGSEGADHLLGGTGNDTHYGGAGDDYAYGDSGNDILYGGDGNDELRGGAGHDTHLGGNGDDHLLGWSGNDVLDGGIGSDILEGGAGNDNFVFRSGDGSDTIADFSDGTDLIRFESTELIFDDLTFDVVGADTTITYGADAILVQNIAPNQLTQDDFLFT